MNLSLEQQRIRQAEIQITELQKDNTRLINETRMLRAQLKATRAILIAAFVDNMVGYVQFQDKAVMRYTGQDRSAERDAGPELSKLNEMRAVFERIELLEKDAWTGCATLAREFMKEANELLAKDFNASGVANAITFVADWRTKFKDLIGD